MIPIGRHSLMNGIGLPADATTEQAEVATFATGLKNLLGRINDLKSGRAESIARICCASTLLWAGTPRLDEYLAAVGPGTRAQLSEEQSFKDLCAFYVPKASIEG